MSDLLRIGGCCAGNLLMKQLAKSWLPFFSTLVVVSWLAAPCLVLAQNNAIDKVEVGLAGRYKVGAWTPVRITLSRPSTGEGESLTLTTVDVDGVNTDFVGPPLKRGEQVVWRYVKFGHATADLTVVLRSADGETRRTVRSADLAGALPSTSELLVTLGSGAGVEEAVAQRRRRGDRVTAIAHVEHFLDLPDHPLGLEAVDALIVTTGELEWRQLPGRQTTALCDWVRLGGQMILSVGADGEHVFKTPGGLSALAPGPFERVVHLSSLPALETFAGSMAPVESSGNQERFQLSAFTATQGKVEVRTGTGATTVPLVVRYPVGLGVVTFFAADLDAPALRRWSGRPKLVNKLLAFHEAGQAANSQSREVALPSQLGYADLAGQLRMALDQYTGVRLTSFSWIAALVVGYLLLIGPADYFFLKRATGRMVLTWLTLPLVALAVIALAIWLGATARSAAVLANQADVVDVDLAAGVLRGQSWIHVYSPRTAAYNLSAQATAQSPDRQAASQALGWSGLPGNGLGGLDGRAAPRLFDAPSTLRMASLSDQAAIPAIDAIPFAAASSKTYTARWRQASSFHDAGQLQVSGDGALSGTLKNPFDFELTDCALLCDEWHYRLPGSLAPGQAITIDDRLERKSLQWQLTQKRTVAGRDLVTAWDPRSRDVPRILEMMMFHKAAGGDAYTGLASVVSPGLDLSEHLRLGRAVLVGRAARRAWDVNLTDAAAEKRPVDWNYDQTYIYYRLILPVRRESP